MKFAEDTWWPRRSPRRIGPRGHVQHSVWTWNMERANVAKARAVCKHFTAVLSGLGGRWSDTLSTSNVPPDVWKLYSAPLGPQGFHLLVKLTRTTADIQVVSPGDAPLFVAFARACLTWRSTRSHARCPSLFLYVCVCFMWRLSSHRLSHPLDWIIW